MSVIDDVRLSAYNQHPTPDESWKAPELVMWYAFRELYRDFRDRKFDKRMAEQIKAGILKRYQTQKTEYDVMQNVLRSQANMWSRIEIAGNRYGTDRTIENADAFFEAVYGARLKPTANASDPEG